MRTRWLLVMVPAVLLAGVVALPAPAADDPPTRKELAASQHNLKRIALGVIDFCDANRSRLPTDIADKDAEPLLSWRVTILPYIGEEKLYKQFKLDEPWDSDTNKKLIEKMPKIYAPVRVKAKAGETFYQTFSGEDALFGPKNKPLFPASIPDGTSQTAMVVEAGEPVIWSQPVDLPFDEKKPLPKLGGLFDGNFHVVMCDGSVKFLKKNPDEKWMKLVVMPADGSVIDFDKHVKPTPES